MQLEAERGSSLGSARMRGIVRKSIQAIQAQAPGAPQSHTQEPCLIVHQISLSTLDSLRALRVLRGEYFSRARHFALFPLAGKHLALYCFLIVGDELILSWAAQIWGLAFVEETGGAFYNLATD